MALNLCKVITLSNSIIFFCLFGVRFYNFLVTDKKLQILKKKVGQTKQKKLPLNYGLRNFQKKENSCVTGNTPVARVTQPK